ncbi:MAG: hypothetical protein AAF206_27280 [Bacteroidota bacterium]
MICTILRENVIEVCRLAYLRPGFFGRVFDKGEKGWQKWLDESI